MTRDALPEPTSICARRLFVIMPLLAILLFASTVTAARLNYAPDPFRGYDTQEENRIFVSGELGEKVDPWTGNLSLSFTDLVLPGKAGLDLRIIRQYTSKIWTQVDYDPGNTQTSPLIGEHEPSALGYGWTMHMGRIVWSGGFGNWYFTFQSPDGKTVRFSPDLSNPPAFPTNGGSMGNYISVDGWRYDENCDGVGAKACMWTDTGLKFEFDRSSAYYDPGSRWHVLPVSKIVDGYGNSISIDYYYQYPSQPLQEIVDSLGRRITFTYDAYKDRITQMFVDDPTDPRVYEYVYQSMNTNSVGVKDFLVEVKPPEGPSWRHEYVPASANADISQNPLAISKVIYPTGGSLSYEYAPATFYTGQVIPITPTSEWSARLAVVVKRTQRDRGASSGNEWLYEYSSAPPIYLMSDPGNNAPDNLDTTTISRPDGLIDVYTFFGFGTCHYHDVVIQGSPVTVADVWRVGSPREVRIAAGSPEEERTVHSWEGAPSSFDAGTVGRWPVAYESGWTMTAYDHWVFIPLLTRRDVLRDGKLHRTSNSNFDEFGQPRDTVEEGDLSRSIHRTYKYWTTQSNPILPDPPASAWISRGHPSTIETCSGTVVPCSCAAGSTGCIRDSYTYVDNGITGPNGAVLTSSPSGVTTTFAYDGSGQLSQVTDAAGAWVKLLNYQWGKPETLETDACTIQRDVNWSGNIVARHPCEGGGTYFGYDSIGRLRNVWPPLSAGISTTYDEDASGYVVSVTTARDTMVNTTLLDGFARVVGTTDSEGVKTSRIYNAMGQVSFESYPYVNPPVTGDATIYDGLGRPTLVTHPDTTSRSWDYDTDKVTVTDEEDHSTELFYEAYGDPAQSVLAKVKDASTFLWLYEYNLHGSLTSVDAPGPFADRTLTYDSRNFLVAELHPESGLTSYINDGAGNLLFRTDALNRTTELIRDNLRRVTFVDFPSGTADDVSIDYDDMSRVEVESSVNGGSRTYHYDWGGRMYSMDFEIDGHLFTTGYAFDATNTVAWMKYPTKPSYTELKRDTQRRLRGIGPWVHNSQGGWGISYHPSGQMESLIRGDGIVTTFGYDPRYRLQSVTSSVQDLFYIHDGTSNVTTYNDGSVGASRRLTYDELGRLDTATGPWGFLDYLYDGLGNRLEVAKDGVLTTYAYNQTTGRLDGVTVGGLPTDAFTWTACGAMATKNGLAYLWDDENRLTQTPDGTLYYYDGSGRRVKTVTGGVPVVTTYAHYDTADLLIGESVFVGGLEAGKRTYIYANGRLVARDDTTDPNGRLFYHTDHQGSALALTNTTGAVVCRLDYVPFGGEQATGPNAGSLRYDGRQLDASGLYYYGARYYDSEVGRFISADTVLGDLSGPQSLNKYAYVMNNPYKYVDPDGHFFWDAIDVGFAVKSIWGLWQAGGNRPISIGENLGVIADVVGAAPGVPSLSMVRRADDALDGAIAAGKLVDNLSTAGRQVDDAAGAASAVPDASKRFSEGQQALVAMAKKDKDAGGISRDDMEAYKQLNKELGPDGFPEKMVRGPESHSGRGKGSELHGHVGPVKHIPVND